MLSMTWRDVLFAHWPVDPEPVRESLPTRVALDTYEGRAWLSVVPFVMDVGPSGVPLSRRFLELNLRTYVRVDGTPGVYFYNLDANDRLGVALARWLFRLPYYRASMAVDRSDEAVRFRSRRTHPDVPPAAFDATYGPDGDPFRPPEGSLSEFLTERYRFYTTSTATQARGGDGRLYYGDIDHDPWTLYPATADVRTNTLFRANGFDHPDTDPVYHYCRELSVTAGRVHRG